jgi:hypothetical protein
VVLTEPFADQIARVLAYQPTDRPLPAVVVRHPMQNVGPEELRARSLQIVDAALRLLRGEEP